ncbi:hypothetical protein MKW98_000139 [Papaver atlanticum]|uniref:MATH domain-containing protein n=1 Tax=Papaver atlanticum TaxID=357466 RepID=A0AAD4ST42_9MAGN|nr:hypothetical protein MKW98_000139 [Papaver atlanticum]
MASGRFTVAGYDWVMHFYPDGFNSRAQEAKYISVYVRLESPGEVRASFEFKLLDQTRKSIHGVPSRSSRSPHTFQSGTSYSQWGYTKYMKKSQVETSDYLKDDCLSTHCTVGVVQTRVAKGNHYVIHVPPSDMPQNCKGRLESKIGYDITFQLDLQYLELCFFGLVGNPSMEIIVVEEFDPFTFKAMLLFLYSDEFLEVHELFDSDSLCTSTTMAQRLLVAADRYGIARLKLMCEAKLYEDITANNVEDTMELADLHNCTELKTACLNFAAKLENLRGKCCI